MVGGQVLEYLCELCWFLFNPAEAWIQDVWFPNHVREDGRWFPNPIMPTMIFHDHANSLMNPGVHCDKMVEHRGVYSFKGTGKGRPHYWREFTEKKRNGVQDKLKRGLDREKSCKFRYTTNGIVDLEQSPIRVVAISWSPR